MITRGLRPSTVAIPWHLYTTGPARLELRQQLSNDRLVQAAALSKRQRLPSLSCSRDDGCVWITPSQVVLTPESNEPPKDTEKNVPDHEGLENIYLKLSEQLPNFFSYPVDYTIYAPDVVFEDNIRKVKTVGLPAYVGNISILRILAHLRYSHVKLEVLKITQHPEDNTVKVRWRIVGLPGMFSRAFWRNKLWDGMKKLTSKDNANWTDGFSVFYVNAEGRISKHVCDKMIPDADKEVAKKTPLGIKLAVLLGLMPKPEGSTDDDGDLLGEIFSLLMQGPF